MLEFTRNLSTAQYQNDNPEYQIHHATIRDATCDLLILACSPDKKTKIIIPVDKTIMTENLKYFEAMFREGSNWEETQDTKNNDPSKPQTIEIEIDDPKTFAHYLESIYTKKLKITPKNCIDYFMIAEFLQDEQVGKIETYIKSNLRYENIIDITAKTDRFDQDIAEFVSRNNFYSEKGDYSSRHNKIKSFSKKLLKLPSERFGRMVSILQGAAIMENTRVI